MEKRLTEYSKASGCGCKVQPAVLDEILGGLRLTELGNLIVGNDQGDDCSVYDLGGGQYLLQTVDFFTPLVDDAFVYGQAAAANALSDVWAMGGRPVMANAVMGWPVEDISVLIARRVMEGALDICNRHGVSLAGGHTIESKEPMFGLSVTGLIDAKNLKRNGGAKVGDILILTKPLGLGMMSAALKRGLLSSAEVLVLESWLVSTNHVGEILGGIAGVNAMTDVTGFGLAGHLLEMCDASAVGAGIEVKKLPRLAEAERLAAQFILPDNAMRNWNAYQEKILLEDGAEFAWLVDPQSSGGLLISVSSEALGAVEAALRAASTFHKIIGKIENLNEIGRSTKPLRFI